MYQTTLDTTSRPAAPLRRRAARGGWHRAAWGSPTVPPRQQPGTRPARRRLWTHLVDREHADPVCRGRAGAVTGASVAGRHRHRRTAASPCPSGAVRLPAYLRGATTDPRHGPADCRPTECRDRPAASRLPPPGDGGRPEGHRADRKATRWCGRFKHASQTTDATSIDGDRATVVDSYGVRWAVPPAAARDTGTGASSYWGQPLAWHAAARRDRTDWTLGAPP